MFSSFSSGVQAARPRLPATPSGASCFTRVKPAAGAEVTLVPTDPTLASSLPMQPHAEVGPDGSFVIATYATADGAPAGDYKLVFRVEEAQPGG